MRAQDLRYPFSWDERQVVIADGVWYVPQQIDNYETFPFAGWHDLFGNSNPIHIEYCSGNGSWIADRAKKNPTINWLAIEKKFERVKKIWAKGKRSGLDNLKTLCGEGFLATRSYFPAASVDHVYINFPDPWPKERHAKHRIVQRSFVEELDRILKPGGGVTIVTDDTSYSEQIITVFQEYGKLESEIPAPYYALEREGYGTSYFEELWRSRGLEIRYHQYRQKG
jgi:tRNA (guanine-N7-)-methyltransferase